VWILSGIWFLSAAAAVCTSIVGEMVTHPLSLCHAVGYLFEVRAPVIVYHLSLGAWSSPSSLTWLITATAISKFETNVTHPNVP